MTTINQVQGVRCKVQGGRRSRTVPIALYLVPNVNDPNALSDPNAPNVFFVSYDFYDFYDLNDFNDLALSFELSAMS